MDSKGKYWVSCGQAKRHGSNTALYMLWSTFPLLTPKNLLIRGAPAFFRLKSTILRPLRRENSSRSENVSMEVDKKKSVLPMMLILQPNTSSGLYFEH